MELTIEQHLKNVQVAVKSHKATFEELMAIRESFNYISRLLLEKKEEIKKEDIIKP